MNIVFLASNKERKNLEAQLKGSPHHSLGNEPAIKGATATRIVDNYAPHAVVVGEDVQEKEGITKLDIITLLHAKRAALRIIYISQNLSMDTLIYLKENGVYDVIRSGEELLKTLDHPMSEDDIDQMIKDIIEAEREQNVLHVAQSDGEFAQEEREPLLLAFRTVTESTFDLNDIGTKNEPIVTVTPQPLLIGIAQLQHHNGCTHTAFEIAALLKKEKHSVCVVLTEQDTYENLAAFHNLHPEGIKDGIDFSGIPVFPLDKLNDAKKKFSCIICDFSFLREDDKRLYSSMHVRIMLCSGAEWDIATTMRFINYPSDMMNVYSIAYCFPRIAKAKFIGYAKQILKAGCNAFRLQFSEDWKEPCADNVELYHHLLRNYLYRTDKKEKKGFFGR